MCPPAMRILAWNINHRTRKMAVAAAIPAGILSLNPDAVVMTDYVEGPDHIAFCAALAAGGLLSGSTPQPKLGTIRFSWLRARWLTLGCSRHRRARPRGVQLHSCSASKFTARPDRRAGSHVQEHH